MKTTLKNIEIINSINAIREFLNYELEGRLSWKLNKNLKKLLLACKDFEEQELKLIDECIEKDNDGNLITDEKKNDFKYKNGKRSHWIQKKTELLEFTDEIDIHMIKLADIENVKIKGNILNVLDYMIDDSGI